MSELLILKDKVIKLQQTVQNSALEQIASDAKQTDSEQEPFVQPSDGERLQKEVEIVQLALVLSLQEKPNQIKPVEPKSQ